MQFPLTSLHCWPLCHKEGKKQGFICWNLAWFQAHTSTLPAKLVPAVSALCAQHVKSEPAPLCPHRRSVPAALWSQPWFIRREPTLRNHTSARSSVQMQPMHNQQKTALSISHLHVFSGIRTFQWSMRSKKPSRWVCLYSLTILNNLAVRAVIVLKGLT